MMPLRRRLAVLTPLTLCCTIQAQTVHGVDVTAMDTTCAPCRAFYQYANGTWIRQARLTGSRQAIGALDEMQDHVAATLHAILDSLASAHPDAHLVAGKVGRFYASCMDSTRIRREGSAPVRDELRRIDAITSLAALQEEAARLNRQQAGVLFNFAALPDQQRPTLVRGDLSAGGLGLPSPEYYTVRNSTTQRVLLRYEHLVERLLVLTGASPESASVEAHAALDAESTLAQAAVSGPSRTDPTRTYHVLSMRALDRLTPDWHWETYFATEFDSVNVQDPEYFASLDRALRTVPLPSWKSYLRAQLLETAAPWLSDAFARVNDSLAIALGGSPFPATRGEFCVQQTDQQLGNALGEEYVRRSFTPRAKARALGMVRAIEAVLRTTLDTLSWMQPSTRREAIAKLDHFVVKIGYPDHWPDYSRLQIADTSLWDNVVQIAEFRTRQQLARLGQPVDRSSMQYTPQTVDGYFDPRRNEVGLAAGYLQPPFFDSLADDAANYGGIGVVIGHELTHAFDEQGRRYDSAGTLRDWWSPVDDSAFRRRAALLARQYDDYIVVDSLHIRGEQTLSENLADLGGVLLAYEALVRSRDTTPRARRISGLTREQEFFLAYAQSRRGVFSPAFLRNMVLTNNHSPAEWRVLGPIANLPAFARTFGCRPTDPMVRPESLAVHLW